MNKSIAKSKNLKNPKIVKSTWWENLPYAILICIVSFCLIWFFVNMYVYSYFIVKNNSMLPTLNGNASGINDAVYVNTIAEVEVGDIIVVNNVNASYSVIKRLIAKSGDKIGFISKSTENGDVIRKFVRIPKGQKTYYELDEYYLKDYTLNEYAYKKFQNLIATSDNIDVVDGIVFLTVGEGEIFYVGDNRKSSYDCLNYGCVSEKLLIGRVDVIIKEQRFFIIQYFMYFFGIKKV